MKISMILLGILAASTSAFANPASPFCATQAVAAAKALANTNGTVSADVDSIETKNGKLFTVVLSEPGLGRDTYSVLTSGAHDCIASAVKVKGQPTLRP